MIKNEFIVFNKATTTVTSANYNTLGADSLYLQVEGTFSNLTLKIKGVMNEAFVDYCEVGAMDISTNIFSSDIDKTGVYKIDVKGFSKITLEISAFAGTDVTVGARLVA